MDTLTNPKAEHYAENGRAPGRTFVNPINDGPDPWMVYHNGYYYLTTSQHDCIRMWRARRLSELATTPGVVVWKDDDPSRDQQVWAAEFHRIGERWYLYYTASDGVDRNHRIYALESEGDDPMGPYTFKGQVTKEWAIDPGLLIHPDGTLYFLWTGFDKGNALFIARMANPWTVVGEGVVISAPTYAWEQHGFPVNEAPEVLQRDGNIFVIYSACDTGTEQYCLGMLTARADADLLDAASWVKAPEPVFSRNVEGGVFGPGHNGFFKSPDGAQDWIVYHARTTPDYSYEGRTTRAQPFTWGADGRPQFGVPLPLDMALEAPSGEERLAEDGSQ
jgi:GH43 family beta-xylosidase